MRRTMTVLLAVVTVGCTAAREQAPPYELVSYQGPEPRTPPRIEKEQEDTPERRPDVIDLWDEGVEEEPPGHDDVGVVQGRYCQEAWDCYEFGPPLNDRRNKWICMGGACSALLVPTAATRLE